jgi:uncharacterized protein DUF6402
MLSDVTKIPLIMRSKGWVNGARMLEIWFSRPRSAYPAYTTPDTTTIRMDSFVLTFPRARKLFDKMVSERIWSNRLAKAQIETMLRNKGLLAGGQRSFGNFNASVALLDKDYINHRAVGGLLDFDDLRAALGDFDLRVLVSGVVGPLPPPPPKPQPDAGAAPAAAPAAPPGFKVEIREVGIYVRDSFDFEGFQYLGAWSDDPMDFSPMPGPVSEIDVFIDAPNYTPVFNLSFRKWRERTGRGGDFLIFSDIKRVPLQPPDTFVIPR